MNYVFAPNNTVIEYPYSVSKLRSDNSSVSFPAEIPVVRLAEWNVFEVVLVQPPQAQPGQILEESIPCFIDNSWTQTWQLRELNSQELIEQAALVRQQRNALLASSDWTQVADAPVDRTAWANYRQALRDITNQTGFPASITWPVQPN